MLARDLQGSSRESIPLLQPKADVVAAGHQCITAGEVFDGVVLPYNVLLIIASHLHDDWKAMLAFFHVTKKMQTHLFNQYDKLVAPYCGTNISVPIMVSFQTENNQRISLPFRDVNYVLQCNQHLTSILDDLRSQRSEISEYLYRRERSARTCNKACAILGCVTCVTGWLVFCGGLGVGAAFCFGTCKATSSLPFWGRLLMGEGASCVAFTCVGNAVPADDVSSITGCGDCDGCCNADYAHARMRLPLEQLSARVEMVEFLHHSADKLTREANHARFFALNRAIRAFRADQVIMDDETPDVSFIERNRRR